MTLTANVVLVSLYSRIDRRQRKTPCAFRFGQYLSPEVIRRLLLNPQLVEPRKTEISISSATFVASPPSLRNSMRNRRALP